MTESYCPTHKFKKPGTPSIVQRELIGGVHPVKLWREERKLTIEALAEQGKNKGTDHAEGMTLLAPEGSTGPAVLVVYDAAGPNRIHGENVVETDIFML